MLTIMYELGCLLDLKRTETGTKIRLANETFRQHLRENYADVMQAQLSDWIQMILVQGSKELDKVLQQIYIKRRAFTCMAIS